jgi:ATP-dependent helicase/DNAse subunit B
VLARLPVRLGEPAQPDRVRVARPEDVRARRFDSVFVCGLQEGEFPRVAVPEPFLPDDDRRALAAASGLSLPVREEQLERERFLFYLCASRAERLLVLSTRTSDEEGAPQAPSFFLEDVKELFSDALGQVARRRSLSDVVWPLREAPTELGWGRAAAASARRPLAPGPQRLRAPEVLDRLRARTSFSASALEAYADCPVKWLVERLLRPSPLEPDPEQMVRGAYAHRVLEQTFLRLRRRTGSARVTRETVLDAERLLREALAEHQASFPISPRQTRVRAAVRRLEFDLLRYLRHEASRDGDFEPAHLELAFGTREAALPAVAVADGVAVEGVIDRVDTWNGYALVRDYKSGRSVHPVARWQQDHRLQAAVYMLAVRSLRGLEPAGGVYVPLAGAERRPRGLVAAELRERLGSDFYDQDLKPREEFDQHLERAKATVCELVGRLREGDLRPCPESCGWRGEGCSYPAICREER